MARTRSWLKKNGITSTDPRTAQQAAERIVENRMWAKMSLKGNPLAVPFYNRSAFFRSRCYVRSFFRMNIAGLDTGLAGLMAIRCGGLYLAPRAIHVYKIAERFKTVCPFCESPGAETLEHLFLRCTRWADERTAFLTNILTAINELSNTLDDKSTVTILLGGGGSASAHSTPFTLGERWSRFRRNKPNPFFIDVVRFLSAIFRVRRAIFFSCRVDTSSSPAAPG